MVYSASLCTIAPQVRRHAVATLRMAGDDEQPLRPPVNRGVSINQDGESNVWAIEPKMEIDTKSSEEKSKGAIIAVGGLVAFTAVAAFVLTNLPDPNQFSNCATRTRFHSLQPSLSNRMRHV